MVYPLSIPHYFLNKDCFVQGCFRQGVFYSLIFKIGKCKGKKNLGNSYTRVILTEIYHLLGMKSSRDDLIDRMKTGWGCFVLASVMDPLRLTGIHNDSSLHMLD